VIVCEIVIYICECNYIYMPGSLGESGAEHQRKRILWVGHLLG